MNAHRERAGQFVAVLLTVEDVAVEPEEQTAYGMNDSRGIRTGQGQYELRMHAISLQRTMVIRTR
jgi:hypothetical protein